MRSLGWVQFHLTGVLMKRKVGTQTHRGMTAWGHREGTATACPGGRPQRDPVDDLIDPHLVHADGQAPRRKGRESRSCALGRGLGCGEGAWLT